MKVEVVNITPALAREWLKTNTQNRTLYRTTVNGIKAALERGEYIQTHQGIAFDTDGVLMDGQHRLTAISELHDGAAFPMLVATGLPRAAFLVTDIGKKRTQADVLEEDRRIVEVARLIALMCDTRKGSITPQQLVPILDRIRSPHDALLAFAPRNIKTWSAAPVRTAAVVSALHGVDFDFIKAMYRSLVMMDYGVIPQSGLALVKSVTNGSARPSDAVDFFARCMIVFEPKNVHVTKIQLKDNSKAVGYVRSLFAESAEKKKATTSAAKGVIEFDFNRFLTETGAR